MKFRYFRRAIEPRIRKAGENFPVIILTGPRQSGKSTLLSRIFPKHTYVSLDDPSFRALAKRDPKLFLSDFGSHVFIDEIQYAPELLPFIKMSVDRNPDKGGAFVLTGSQIFPLMAGVSESLAGRAAIFELLGFSWEEMPSAYPSSPASCFRQIFNGFYPRPALYGVPAREYYSSYLRTYLERDIRQVKAVHDLNLFQSFLELLAARAGSLLNLSDLARDCGISPSNAKQWISLLETTRILYLLRPYFRNLSKRIVKSPKVYFTDTGLLSYLLKYPNSETLRAGPMAGSIFENMIVIEFLKQKFNHDRPYELYFLRDSNNVEADILLDRGTGVELIEIKSSMTHSEREARPLENLGTSFKSFAGTILSQADRPQRLSAHVKVMPWPFFEQIAARS